MVNFRIFSLPFPDIATMNIYSIISTVAIK